MKFVTVRDLRLKPGQIWKLAKKEKDLVLTSNGRPVAILTGVDENTFEGELDAIKRARTLNVLDSIHKDALMKGSDRITAEEIESEIQAVRREKR